MTGWILFIALMASLVVLVPVAIAGIALLCGYDGDGNP